MKVARSTVWDVVTLAATLGIIVWVFFFSDWFFHSHASNASNRAALNNLYQNIELGSSAAEVREIFSRHASPQLTLHDELVGEWLIRMPAEFGATDWKLLLDFQEERVTRVRLRTADGPAPKDGPPDKQFP